MELDDRAVQRQRVQVDGGQCLALQLGGHPLQDARLRPAVEPHLDRVPVAELARQATPGAALVEHVEPGVQHPEMRNLEMIARRRQQRRQSRLLRVAQFPLVAHLLTVAAPPTIPTVTHLRRDVNRP